MQPTITSTGQAGFLNSGLSDPHLPQFPSALSGKAPAHRSLLQQLPG